jgi:hypothetical protein
LNNEKAEIRLFLNIEICNSIPRFTHASDYVTLMTIGPIYHRNKNKKITETNSS